MKYRRFGRTGLQMPVFSCGGMRYQKTWAADADIDEPNQANVDAVVRRALEMGINHFETARGYGTSEIQLGRALRDIPRETYLLQTKGTPKFTEAEFRAELHKSLFLLGVDHLDLFGIHGINNQTSYEQVFQRGCLEAALEFKRQGKLRFLGFSTHGPTDLIVKVIESGRFDYVNLHWYYINQTNWPAVEAAARRDMGVFIISPSDKGGKLYEPTARMSELCRPLTPMQFNDLFCLRRPQVHTLSIGAAKPSDFDEHVAVLDRLEDTGALDRAIDPIVRRLDDAMAAALGREWRDTWRVGLPEWADAPGEINVQTIVWLWNMVKAFDLVGYGKMRYELLGKGADWFPGQHAGKLVSGEIPRDRMREALGRHAAPDRVIEILTAAHEHLASDEQRPSTIR